MPFINRYYAQVQVTKQFGRGARGQWGRQKRGRAGGSGGGGDSDGDSATAAVATSKAVYLKFQPDARERGSVYAKHDLWVLASGPGFGVVDTEGGSRHAAGHRSFVTVCEATWHGPSRENVLEVSPIGSGR